MEWFEIIFFSILTHLDVYVYYLRVINTLMILVKLCPKYNTNQEDNFASVNRKHS